jgi:DUF1009 family protein
VEHTLGLMCGAGTLPARMAAEARRRGWRVLAFAFDEPALLTGQADRVVPARFDALGPVLATLQAERAASVLFSGRFSMSDIVRADTRQADRLFRSLNERAGSRIDAAFAGTIIATLAGFGIEVLDQRPFFGEALVAAGPLTRRMPSEAEAADIRRGVEVARSMADAHVGQTVVVRHGVITAVEAVEGTTEAIRRGTQQAGPGAVVVKVAARDHDYRFDVPGIGMETLEAARAGEAAVLAIESDRVAVLDREGVVEAANTAGIAITAVSVP